jgi:ABC-2 type transport system ATP-binding protein
MMSAPTPEAAGEPSAEPALALRGLRKRFGKTVAVDGLSLSVRKGEILGLLGPNGAGKSTTVHMAVGLLSPDEGEVQVAGLGSPRQPEVRRQLGVAPQALALYEALSAEENLRFFGQIYGLSGRRLAERVDWALEFSALTERRRDAAGTFSGGMKRRLNLAAALVHDPRILLLDEPTVGVDPQSRNAILERIAELRQQGRTVVYTTHYMEEVTRLCASPSSTTAGCWRWTRSMASCAPTVDPRCSWCARAAWSGASPPQSPPRSSPAFWPPGPSRTSAWSGPAWSRSSCSSPGGS